VWSPGLFDAAGRTRNCLEQENTVERGRTAIERKPHPAKPAHPLARLHKVSSGSRQTQRNDVKACAAESS
jgi:hypothetical protein